jgi:signal transduction histidine kinase
LEFARLQDELQKSREELASANAALRASERELEQRVEERTRELATLLRVSNNITSTLELGSLLGLILDQLREVVEYRLASISALENDVLVLLKQRGDPSPMLLERENLSDHPNTLRMLEAGRPLIIPDLNADTYLAGRVRGNIVKRGQEAVYAGSNSWMSIPLVARDKPVGALILTHAEVNYYTPARAELAMAFANYAAIAVENARLYAQAGRLAALEERQKLARELHDSVSQALYGIALGARTARTLLDREPDKAAEPMDYILSLAEAGLAEMRALIFELRPESLETEGLVAALGKLVNALGARHQLEVRLDAGDEPDVSMDVKESLYRIAQEATNNIAKHAQAKHIEVRLMKGNEQLILMISDDGVGFDTNGEFPGHLGMHTMHERAEKAGGRLTIVSTANTGTQIQVMIPLVTR